MYIAYVDPGNRKRQANKMYELDLAVNSLIWKKTFLSDYQLATFAVKKKKKKMVMSSTKDSLFTHHETVLAQFGTMGCNHWPNMTCRRLLLASWYSFTKPSFFSFCNYEVWDSELANTPAFQVIARKERFYQFYWSLKGTLWLNNKKKVPSSAL